MYPQPELGLIGANCALDYSKYIEKEEPPKSKTKVTKICIMLTTFTERSKRFIFSLYFVPIISILITLYISEKSE